MFKQKNALIAVAVAMLLAACGGGGGSDPAPTGTDTQNQTGNQNPTPTPPQTVADVALASQLTLAQVLVSPNPATSGGQFATELFSNPGLYGQAPGANGSPLKNFGVKFMPEKSDAGASGNGHIAIEINDASGSQEFQISIDQVNYVLTPGTATGEFQASVPNTAKAYVHVSNAAGVADLVLDNLPADIVTVLSGFTDDASYRGLMLDIEKLFGAAIAKASTDTQKAALAAVQTYKGEFNMNATYSALNIVKGGQPSAGADITVEGANQPAITGSGVKGKLWIGENPPGV